MIAGDDGAIKWNKKKKGRKRGEIVITNVWGACELLKVLLKYTSIGRNI